MAREKKSMLEIMQERINNMQQEQDDRNDELVIDNAEEMGDKEEKCRVCGGEVYKKYYGVPYCEEHYNEKKNESRGQSNRSSNRSINSEIERLKREKEKYETLYHELREKIAVLSPQQIQREVEQNSVLFDIDTNKFRQLLKKDSRIVAQSVIGNFSKKHLEQFLLQQVDIEEFTEDKTITYKVGNRKDSQRSFKKGDKYIRVEGSRKLTFEESMLVRGYSYTAQFYSPDPAKINYKVGVGRERYLVDHVVYIVRSILSPTTIDFLIIELQKNFSQIGEVVDTNLFKNIRKYLLQEELS